MYIYINTFIIYIYITTCMYIYICVYIYIRNSMGIARIYNRQDLLSSWLLLASPPVHPNWGIQVIQVIQGKIP